MAKTARKLEQELLKNSRPECAILRGTYLAGAGPARFGWFAQWPTGKMEYLGKSLPEAVAKVTGQ